MYALYLPGEGRPASRGERVTPLMERFAAFGKDDFIGKAAT